MPGLNHCLHCYSFRYQKKILHYHSISFSTSLNVYINPHRKLQNLTGLLKKHCEFLYSLSHVPHVLYVLLTINFWSLDLELCDLDYLR